MEVFSYPTLIFIALISLFFFYFLKKYPNKSGFKIYPLVGALPEFLLNRHRFLEWTTNVLSNCTTNTAVFYRPGNIHGVMTANPLNVEHMLKANFENFPKGFRFYTRLQDFLGDGIFNVDGEIWKIQRKSASYEFSTRSLRNFVMHTAQVEIHTRLIPILEEASKRGTIIDIQDILERFAFDNIIKLAFNVDANCLGGAESEFMQAFDIATTLSSGRFMYAIPFLYKIKKILNIGSEKKLQKSIKVVHEFADNIINSRMEERDEKKDEDLLSRFMGDSNEVSAKFLRDIVISFILAGRDTTSSALTWFFWILSSRKDIEQKILEELVEIRGRNGKKIGEAYNFDELREMQYLHAAISESMRLYPPVPIDTRSCLKDEILPDGTFIGKDWFISYQTYSMGRMENIWGKDCCEYKPERWFDENGVYKQESPFKFPVFHAGPRMCLGKDMAYIQMKSIAASVLEMFEFDVQLENGKCPEYVLSLTLRMKGGLPVKVKERCK
ncbi:cytochrome P450 94A2 isoform X1 [Solanum pennellii]|uniref:Cytochrome P450 94A2 isoform X1 n=1 Tax=Solanum pennellii TaxID=28526 RepID=A0ABM1FE74_SOLPN|nr:cytochrome P450 94A2 isoform X1 [Solanum pennellii]